MRWLVLLFRPDEASGKCMLGKKRDKQTVACRRGGSFGFHRVCVCLLSLALVLPQYSKHYIKAKIGDTITQAKCKCRQQSPVFAHSAEKKRSANTGYGQRAC